MKEVFIVKKGYGFLDKDGNADELFVIQKAFQNKEAANKEAFKLFKDQVKQLYVSKTSNDSNFEEFFSETTNSTYVDENSNLNGFFISMIDDYFCFGFEDDKEFKKPECIIKVTTHTVF